MTQGPGKGQRSWASPRAGRRDWRQLPPAHSPPSPPRSSLVTSSLQHRSHGYHCMPGFQPHSKTLLEINGFQAQRRIPKTESPAGLTWVRCLAWFNRLWGGDGSHSVTRTPPLWQWGGTLSKEEAIVRWTDTPKRASLLSVISGAQGASDLGIQKRIKSLPAERCLEPSCPQGSRTSRRGRTHWKDRLERRELTPHPTGAALPLHERLKYCSVHMKSANFCK